MTLADIRVVATLGVGGFGRVELVRTFVKSNFTRIACSVQNTKIFSERPYKNPVSIMIS